MKDNLSIVILTIVLVLLMVFFPLYNFFERQDDMSYNLVLKATTSFADEVMNNGYIDQDMYDKLVNDISATGNIYDIEIEAHKKVKVKANGNTSTDSYTNEDYIDYSDDIFSSIENSTSSNTMARTLKDNIYKLNQKDEIYVKVKNSNITMAGALFNALISTSKKNRIEVNYGGIVKNNAWEKVNAKYNKYDKAPNKPKLYLDNNVLENTNVLPISNISSNDIISKGLKLGIDNNAMSRYRVEISANVINANDKTTLNVSSPTSGTDYTTPDKIDITIDDLSSYSTRTDYRYIEIQAYVIDTTTSIKSDTTTFKFKVNDSANSQTNSVTGDLTGNGNVDNDDVIRLDQYFGNNTALDETNKNADINGDGKIDIRDLDYIIQLAQNGYILGDVNGDHEVNESDIEAINTYITGSSNFSNNQISAANVDQTDSNINNKDVTALTKLVNNKLSYTLGDINHDFIIDSKDLELIKSYISEDITFNKLQERLADVNQDNFVDLKDQNKIESLIK